MSVTVYLKKSLYTGGRKKWTYSNQLVTRVILFRLIARIPKVFSLQYLPCFLYSFHSSTFKWNLTIDPIICNTTESNEQCDILLGIFWPGTLYICLIPYNQTNRMLCFSIFTYKIAATHAREKTEGKKTQFWFCGV